MTATATGLQLSISAPTLAEAVGKVARIVPARAHMPVLSGILVETDGQAVQLTATNLETGIRVRVPAEVRQQGAVVVPAKLLAGALTGLPEAPVELTLEPESLTLRLRCAGSRANIRCLPSKDFPPGPTDEGGDRVAIDMADLLDGVAKTVPFVATSDQRPVYTAVLFHLTSSGLTLASSDGYRLAECRLPIDPDLTEELRLLVPGRAAAEIPRAFKGESGDVEMIVSERRNQVFFRAGDAEVCSRLVEGTYPTYQQVIPPQSTTTVSLPTEALKQALGRAVVFAEETAVARFVADAGRLVVCTERNLVGDSEIELPATVDGPPAEIRLNARYVSDVLGVLGDTAELRLNDAISPAMIVDPDDDGYLHVLLAVRKAAVA